MLFLSRLVKMWTWFVTSAVLLSALQTAEAQGKAILLLSLFADSSSTVISYALSSWCL